MSYKTSSFRKVGEGVHDGCANEVGHNWGICFYILL